MSQEKAANVRAPRENATGNVSTVKFTVGVSSASDVIPREFCGEWVRITVVGANMAYLFDTDDSAEVDFGIAATAAGETDPTVGDYLGNGVSDHFRIPDRPVQGDVYFVREGSATGDVYIRRAS